ncbi:lactococcin G-alpha/enterocin 1071A family bacteriocin [uncultured Leuconostoc sp.]|nr:lactococcin G-alpha/enterocin 1071A family bacteriocin [uncultured Leuconostoc sp.]
MEEINNFQRINNDDLNKISGGGFFSFAGEVAGSGLYYFCKGCSAIKG